MIHITAMVWSICAILVFGLFLYRRRSVAAKSNDTAAKSAMSRHAAATAVGELAELGYFQYADPGDVEALTADLVSAFSDYGVLSTLYHERPTLPKDFRYYIFDGESVFEQDGYSDMLKNMQATFDKMGVKMEVTNEIEAADNGLLNHELTVNGKRYVIFKDFRGYGWGEAAYKFADMVNDQLALQHKDERLYLINGGNDGRAIFLSRAQFELLDKLITDIKEKPFRLNDWCKAFDVTPVG